MAILHAYSHLATHWHRLKVSPEVLAGLPREKQVYFREPDRHVRDKRDPAPGPGLLERLANSVGSHICFRFPGVIFDRLRFPGIDPRRHGSIAQAAVQYLVARTATALCSEWAKMAGQIEPVLRYTQPSTRPSMKVSRIAPGSM